MKGYRLILTLLIAMAFAFGTIACENKEAEEQPTTEAPTEAPPEAPPEAPAEEPEPPAAPEGGTNGEPAEGAESQ